MPPAQFVCPWLRLGTNVLAVLVHSYLVGFTGRWMWSAQPAKKVWFKTVWSNAGFGQGQGSRMKILCDNSFLLFHNR